MGLEESPWLDAETWVVQMSPVGIAVDGHVDGDPTPQVALTGSPVAPISVRERLEPATEDQASSERSDIRFWASSVQHWLRSIP